MICWTRKGFSLSLGVSLLFSFRWVLQWHCVICYDFETVITSGKSTLSCTIYNKSKTDIDRLDFDIFSNCCDSCGTNRKEDFSRSSSKNLTRLHLPSSGQNVTSAPTLIVLRHCAPRVFTFLRPTERVRPGPCVDRALQISRGGSR